MPHATGDTLCYHRFTQVLAVEPASGEQQLELSTSGHLVVSFNWHPILTSSRNLAPAAYTTGVAARPASWSPPLLDGNRPAGPDTLANIAPAAAAPASTLPPARLVPTKARATAAADDLPAAARRWSQPECRSAARRH